jgi:hypothetical protein
MARTKISEYSAVPSENTDINGINIAENCPPSGINDAIRTLMADLKDWQAGTSGDGITVADLRVTGAVTFANPLPIASGGTGAASATNARSNLGITGNFVEQTGTTGAAKLPVGTDAQRPTPAAGYLRFNSDSDAFEGYNGTVWGAIGGGAAVDMFYENAQTLSTSYTITSNKNAMTTGPIAIADGVTLTIPDGSRVVIL